MSDSTPSSPSQQGGRGAEGSQERGNNPTTPTASGAAGSAQQHGGSRSGAASPHPPVHGGQAGSSYTAAAAHHPAEETAGLRRAATATFVSSTRMDEDLSPSGSIGLEAGDGWGSSRRGSTPPPVRAGVWDEEMGEDEDNEQLLRGMSRDRLPRGDSRRAHSADPAARDVLGHTQLPTVQVNVPGLCSPGRASYVTSAMLAHRRPNESTEDAASRGPGPIRPQVASEILTSSRHHPYSTTTQPHPHHPVGLGSGPAGVTSPTSPTPPLPPGVVIHSVEREGNSVSANKHSTNFESTKQSSAPSMTFAASASSSAGGQRPSGLSLAPPTAGSAAIEVVPGAVPRSPILPIPPPLIIPPSSTPEPTRGEMHAFAARTTQPRTTGTSRWSTASSGASSRTPTSSSPPGGHTQHRLTSGGSSNDPWTPPRTSPTAPSSAGSSGSEHRSLVCFDFDECIMNIHMWVTFRNSPIEAIPTHKGLFGDFSFFTWLIPRLVEIGVQVAIATFGRQDVVLKMMNFAFGEGQTYFTTENVSTPAWHGAREGSSSLGNKDTQLLHLSRQLVVPCQRILFFDDTLHNVRGARALGVAAHEAKPFSRDVWSRFGCSDWLWRTAHRHLGSFIPPPDDEPRTGDHHEDLEDYGHLQHAHSLPPQGHASRSSPLSSSGSAHWGSSTGGSSGHNSREHRERPHWGSHHSRGGSFG